MQQAPFQSADKRHLVWLVQAGHLDQARRLGEQLCQSHPQDPEVWQALAQALLQQGRYPEARDALVQLTRIRPDHTEALTNLGNVYLTLGQLDEAIDSYRQVLRRQPRNAVARNNLGSVLKRAGRLAEARTAYEQALKEDPGLLDARLNLARVQLAQGDMKAAQAGAQAILAQAPRTLPAYGVLATTLKHQSRWQEAASCLNKALQIDARYVEAHNNLGVVLNELGRQEEAAAHLQRAVALKPAYVEAYTNLGALYLDAEHYQQAASQYQQALNLDADNPAALKGLGRVYAWQARFNEARTYYRRAWEAAPDDLEPLGLEVVALERQGDVATATARLRELLSLAGPGPATAMAYATMARHLGEEAEALAWLEQALQAPGLLNAQRRPMHFKAGELYDHRGDYDAAFRHYLTGNQLKGLRQDRAAFRRHTQELMSAFSAEALASLPRAGVTSQRPIFIVGMPRSGTSLTEQILASHPAIAGGGELKTLNNLALSLADSLDSQAPYPQCVGELTASAADRLAAQYLEQLARVDDEAPRVTDKMPHNFLHLGLIALLFPQAKVIHCRRDPRDTCLSIFFQDFFHWHDYACDLGDLGHHYRHYQRLMAHWQAVLPLAIYDLDYEALVSEPEAQVANLLAFLALPWDPACLRFHENARLQATASYDQVRRPIYTSSTARWQRYQQHIEPLLAALGDALEPPA